MPRSPMQSCSNPIKNPDNPRNAPIRDKIGGRHLDQYRPGARQSAGQAAGAPTLAADKEASLRALLASGTGIVKAARLAGVGVSAVQRIKADMGAAAHITG